MPRIAELVWDEWNENHIRDAHKITTEVAEQIVFDRRSRVFRARKSGGRPRYVFIGSTLGGRAIVVFVDDLGDGYGYAVTARQLTEKEKRRYLRKRG